MATVPKISVICAIFNRQDTLSRCLDSILSQSFQDFELILVNDGSTDKSAKICDEYAISDDRIHVVHKPNEGVASARQCGLSLARGEYMIHIDPDDWIEPETFKILYESAKRNNSKIVICDYNLISSQKKQLKIQKPSSMTSIAMMDGILSGDLLGGVCNKLISRELYKCGVEFRSGVNYCEDVLFLAELSNRCSFPISYVNQALYNYDKSAGTSITSGVFTRKKYKSFRAYMDILQKVYPRLTAEEHTKNIYELSLKAFANHFFSGKEFYQEFRKDRKYLRRMECNKILKILILLSSFGFYPICFGIYKVYLRSRQ